MDQSKMKRIGFLGHLASGEVGESYVSIGFEGLDRDLFKPERCYDPLAATGVKHARCQTGWVKCEKEKGVYDFAWLDTIVENLLSRGVSPWFNVGYGNPLYMPDLPNSTGVGCVPIYYGEEALTAWCRYVEALAEHYRGRVTHYEIWNEPDITAFWYPEKPSGEQYAKFVKLTADKIKRTDPDARIGISVSKLYCFGYIEQVLSTLEGGCLDFFSFHAYSTVPEYRFPGAVRHLRESLDSHGFTSAEIWQGEGGYPSWAYKGHWLVKDGCDDERPQAIWQLRRFFLDVYNGVTRCSFYSMADLWEKPYEKSTEVLYKPAAHGILNGLVYTPKKSYETISNLAVLFSGDLRPTREYMHVEMIGGEAEQMVSIQTFSFVKDGYPVYAYYLPASLPKAEFPEHEAKLYVTESIADPVLIDPYTGEVFSVEPAAAASVGYKYLDMPLRAYPVIVTDKRAFPIVEKEQ